MSMFDDLKEKAGEIAKKVEEKSKELLHEGKELFEEGKEKLVTEFGEFKETAGEKMAALSQELKEAGEKISDKVSDFFKKDEAEAPAPAAEAAPKSEEPAAAAPAPEPKPAEPHSSVDKP